MTDDKQLTARQARFCEEYHVDANATQAAIRAGFSRDTAGAAASRLLKNVKIAEEIERLRGEQSKRLQIKADDIVKRLWLLATADPNELIEHRRAACRYCHGSQHRYQRTAGEMERARAAYEKALVEAATEGKASPPPFDEMGGVGYDPRRKPHVDCPECFGEGETWTVAKDTRYLSPAALCLYAGVKQTKDGVEVKMHDQQAATLVVGKRLGVGVERLELTGADGEKLGPLVILGEGATTAPEVSAS